MAELAIGTTVGGAFLSASLQVLFDKLASPPVREFGMLCGVGYELKRLHGTLLKIRYLVGDAEARRIRDPHLAMWLRELKDAAYDAEDVLDEFATEVLRRKSQVSSGFFLSSISPRQFLFDYNIADKINEIRGRLDDIAKERDDLWLGELGDQRRRLEVMRRGRETSSFLTDPDVFGREEEREEVVCSLLGSNGEEQELMSHSLLSSDGSGILPAPYGDMGTNNLNLSILAIVGMGGVGKTTLAQLVYNDRRIDDHFQLKMWVWVSDDFDVKAIIKKIKESAGEATDYGLENLDTLQRRLSEMLRGRRFFLVLDDVWNEDRVEWHKLRAPLLQGEKGSRAVVTTRSAKVAGVMQTMWSLNLEGLSDEDCWRVFQKCAFVDGNSTGNSNLETIGFSIVKRLRGVPLAARTLGGILHSKLEEWRWNHVLESELWELQQGEHDILPTLRLSYQHLPTHLKQCFAYCCLFPKGYTFDKPKLIELWMALRFIHTQRGERAEDVGSDYFAELLGRSLFQCSGDGYVMHDLLHDLAFSVSDDECFMVRDDERHIMSPEEDHNLRHVSFSCHIEFKNLYRFKNLRTLLNLKHSYQQNVPHDLFTNLKVLRILDFSCSRIKQLPDSIGCLKHLRYIDVSYTDIEVLPRSLSSLYNLQCLKLEGCHQLQELPKDISNLINLRHLKANASLLSKIDGIGKLASLQELEVFSVFNSDGHRIGELKDMTGLRGKLCIHNIKNIKSKEEARWAVLSNKLHLDAIELKWVDNGCADWRKARLEEEVLEALQPPPSLRDLAIKSNAGIVYPSWIGNQYLTRLESICLHQCPRWECLPPLGHLPSLRSLQIGGMDGVKKVDLEFCGALGFPSLQVMEFYGMPEWEEWLKPDDGQIFPHLSRLLIRNCPKLHCTNLTLPASLQYLCVDGCPGIINEPLFVKLQSLTSLSFHLRRHYSDLSSCIREALQHLREVQCLQIHFHEDSITSLLATEEVPVSLRYNIDEAPYDKCHSKVSLDIRRSPTFLNNDDNYYHSLSLFMQNHLASLSSLSMNSCLKLTSLLGRVLVHLTSLVELSIDKCEEMISLELLQGIFFLRHLNILHCPDLTSLPTDVLCLLTLEKLKIVDCRELRSYDGLSSLISLKSLEIFDCPKLSSLPGDVLHHLKALEKLYIRGCEELTSLGFQALACLENMKIEKCPKLSASGATLISSSFEEDQGSSLKYLSIDSTSLLTAGSIKNLSSIQELVIHDCHQSRLFQEGEEVLLQSLTCLERFVIFKCAKLQHLPTELHSLSSLKSLRIGYCPQLRSLPEKGLHPSLEHLYISGCHLLQERCRNEGSPNWPTIAQTTEVHMCDDDDEL